MSASCSPPMPRSQPSRHSRRRCGKPCAAAIRLTTARSSSRSRPPASIAGRAASRARRSARTSPSSRAAEAAERAGYRACKRCRPDRLGAPDPQVEAVKRACERIASAEEAPSLADLAAERGPEPLPLPSRLQEGHRRDAEGLCRRRCGRGARPRSSRTAGTVTEAIYDAGLQLFEPLLRDRDGAARHDPDRGPARRRGRDNPLRGRRGFARRGAGRGDRQGRLRHHARRRSGRARARLAGPLPARRAHRRRREFRAHGRRGRRPRRGARPKPRSAARHPRHRLPAEGLAGAARHPAGQDGDLRRDRARRSAGRRRCARSPRPAPPIRSRSRSLAIGWCAPTAACPAIAGASSASASCSTARPHDAGTLAPTLSRKAGEGGESLLPLAGEGGRR